MFVFEMFKPFLDCDYMAAECAGESVCVCVCVRARVCVSPCVRTLVCVSAGSYFFSCNESRWGESVSVPPAPALLLSLWF